MGLYFKLGRRNLWRNIRRTLITVLALAFSLAFMLVTTCLMQGAFEAMMENIIGIKLSELQVHDPLYMSEQSIYQTIDVSDKFYDELKQAEFTIAPRLYGYGMLSSKKSGNSAGVRIEGIDLERESTVTSLLEPEKYFKGQALSGQTKEWTPPQEKKDTKTTPKFDFEDDEDFSPSLNLEPMTLTIGEVVLGRKLAERLDVEIGDRLVAVTMAYDGSIGNELYDVVGVLDNIGAADDRTLALMDMKSFRRLFSFPKGKVHEIALKSHADRTLEASKAKVIELMGDDPRIGVLLDIFQEMKKPDDIVHQEFLEGYRRRLMETFGEAFHMSRFATIIDKIAEIYQQNPTIAKAAFKPEIAPLLQPAPKANVMHNMFVNLKDTTDSQTQFLSKYRSELEERFGSDLEKPEREQIMEKPAALYKAKGEVSFETFNAQIAPILIADDKTDQLHSILAQMKTADDIRQIAFLNGFRESLVEMFGYDYRFYEIEKKLMELYKASPNISREKLNEHIAPFLDDDPRVQTWREIVPNMASMLDSWHAMMFIFTFLMYLAAGIVILNAMLMMVFERIREFGVMKAVGFRPFQVLVLIITETLWLVLLSVIVGLGGGLAASWYLKIHGLDLSRFAPHGFDISGTTINPIWYAEISLRTVGEPVVALVIVALFAVIYPALKAAVLKPVKALTHV